MQVYGDRETFSKFDLFREFLIAVNIFINKEEEAIACAPGTEFDHMQSVSPSAVTDSVTSNKNTRDKLRDEVHLYNRLVHHFRVLCTIRMLRHRLVNKQRHIFIYLLVPFPF